MNKHRFFTQNWQKADLPEHLKHPHNPRNDPEHNQIDDILFNNTIQVNLFPIPWAPTSSLLRTKTRHMYCQPSHQTTVLKTWSKRFQNSGSINMESQEKFTYKKERWKSANYLKNKLATTTTVQGKSLSTQKSNACWSWHYLIYKKTNYWM